MIPKIIHYGLFGGWQLSALDEFCLTTWRQVLPDYEIWLWDDSSAPQTRFCQDAIRMRPVNASNYVKLWALANHGGVFLDNDVEVLQPFDLSPGAFAAFQRDDTQTDCINGAVLGAVVGHPYIMDCLKMLDRVPATADPVWCGCTMLTDRLRRRGLQGLNVEQKLGDIQVYSKDRFYPWRWDEEPDRNRITERTIAVHHWEGSWK